MIKGAKKHRKLSQWFGDIQDALVSLGLNRLNKRSRKKSCLLAYIHVYVFTIMHNVSYHESSNKVASNSFWVMIFGLVNRWTRHAKGDCGFIPQRCFSVQVR